jgi:hypothetical protein
MPLKPQIIRDVIEPISKRAIITAGFVFVLTYGGISGVSQDKNYINIRYIL